MTIDEKLAYLRKALEMGAFVEVKFHRLENEKATKEIITELQPLTLPFEYWDNQGTHWYQANDRDNKLDTVIFFKKNEEVTA